MFFFQKAKNIDVLWCFCCEVKIFNYCSVFERFFKWWLTMGKKQNKIYYFLLGTRYYFFLPGDTLYCKICKIFGFLISMRIVNNCHIFFLVVSFFFVHSKVWLLRDKIYKFSFSFFRLRNTDLSVITIYDWRFYF